MDLERMAQRPVEVHCRRKPLIIDGELISCEPKAHRSWAQQSDRSRAANDRKGSLTKEAAAVYAPINLPPWHPIAHLCDLFHFRGESRPLAIAKADRDDAYKRLPLMEAGELPARNASPPWRSSSVRRQLYRIGCAYCLSPAVTPIRYTYLKIPCVGYLKIPCYNILTISVLSYQELWPV